MGAALTRSVELQQHSLRRDHETLHHRQPEQLISQVEQVKLFSSSPAVNISCQDMGKPQQHQQALERIQEEVL